MLKLTERKASIQPIKSKLRVTVLDDEEIKSINQTALDILEEVGIELPSEKALKPQALRSMWEEAGTRRRHRGRRGHLFLLQWRSAQNRGSGKWREATLN
jgi:trimethylamine:corrinoid methyltransferase-like protein